MTHNTRTVPLATLRYPAFVQYGNRVYRAWRPARLAPPLDGLALHATRPGGEELFVLIYANRAATVQLVVG